MEKKTVYFGFYFVFQGFNPYGLAGGKANDCTFLIVVVVPPVLQVAAFGLLQEKCIYSVIYGDMVYNLGCLGQVDNAYQWM